MPNVHIIQNTSNFDNCCQAQRLSKKTWFDITIVIDGNASGTTPKFHNIIIKMKCAYILSVKQVEQSCFLEILRDLPV